MVEWPDESHSVKSTWQPAWSLPKGTRRTLRPWETKFSGLIKQRLNSLAWMPIVMSGGNHALANTIPTVKRGGGSCGDDFQRQELGDESGLRERWIQQCTETSLMRTCSRVLWTSDWGEGSSSYRTTALSTQDNKGVYLGQLWMSLSGPDLNPIEHLWRDLKIAVHRCSPSNLIELELDFTIYQKWVCQATYSKGCNCCQRCFSKGCEYLCKFLFLIFANLLNIKRTLSLWGIMCRLESILE